MKPYDWESDPENSRLRHPAGRQRPVVQVDVEFTAPWWWVALCLAVVLSGVAVAEFFLGN